MPEGDTIHHAASRIRPLLQGRVPLEILTPHPRTAAARLSERLEGRAVESVEALGKHLLIGFEGALTLHSHLRMTGSWRVRARERSGELPAAGPAAPASPPGPRSARRLPGRAWLVLATERAEVLQLGGPVLELLSAERLRRDPRLRSLGPDILGESFDPGAVLARIRERDEGGPIGEALLDQRAVAGIGNLWKSEACFAAGLDPWRPLRGVSDQEIARVLELARAAMGRSAELGFRARPDAVYRRAGRPCPRCGSPISSRGQGEENRVTYWCPACQS